MTVKQLIKELKKMPQDFHVHFPNMEINQTEPVNNVHVDEVWHIVVIDQ